MLPAIDKSVKHLCQDILNEELHHGKYIKNVFYGASIPLVVNGEELHYYMFLKKDTLQLFARKFLFVEDFIQEDELSDLTKEIINLIIGKAKANMEEESHKSLKLGTPEYLGKVSYPFPVKLLSYEIYKLRNRNFIIGTTHQNG